MKLKHLEIRHKQYYQSKPEGNQYDGSIEFFGIDGHTMKIVLTDDQMSGIVSLVATAIRDATQKAAESIIASLNPHLQLEHEHQNNSPIIDGRTLDCVGVHSDESGQQLGKCSI